MLVDLGAAIIGGLFRLILALIGIAAIIVVGGAVLGFLALVFA